MADLLNLDCGCCSPCMSCSGGFSISGITVGGTFGTQASEDSSIGCPACQSTGNYLFANAILDEEVLGTADPPAGESDCTRHAEFESAECDTLVLDDIWYTDAFGYWMKHRVTIYARETTYVTVDLSFIKIGGVNYIFVDVIFQWFVRLWSKVCTYTTTSTYGYSPGGRDAALDAAIAAELGTACDYVGLPADPLTESWAMRDWTTVTREWGWSETFGSDCRDVCSVYGDAADTTSSVRNYETGSSINGSLLSNHGILRWERDLAGTDTTFTSTATGTLTGTVVGQAFKIKSLIYHDNIYNPNSLATAPDQTYKEPCWPTASTTIDLLCEVTEAPPPDPP